MIATISCRAGILIARPSLSDDAALRSHAADDRRAVRHLVVAAAVDLRKRHTNRGDLDCGDAHVGRAGCGGGCYAFGRFIVIHWVFSNLRIEGAPTCAPPPRSAQRSADRPLRAPRHKEPAYPRQSKVPAGRAMVLRRWPRGAPQPRRPSCREAAPPAPGAVGRVRATLARIMVTSAGRKTLGSSTSAEMPSAASCFAASSAYMSMS